MQKISSSTSTADPNGEFTEGSAAGGIVATHLRAAWLNSVQRELLNVLAEAGLQPDSGNDTQLAAAIRKVVSDALNNLQAKDATLTALAGLVTSANQMIYSTGADKFALSPLTAFMRTLLDDADAGAARDTLGAAALNSPALTGEPTAPTPPLTVSNKQIATTEFVARAVAALVDSSPVALDTLKELAAALGNDANFATTMANALAAKAPLASPALTGNPTTPTAGVGNANGSLIASLAFVKSALATPSLLATAVRGQSQGVTTQDPNLATDPVIVTNHTNSPGRGLYWHITTTFYNSISETANRAQIAVNYNGSSVLVFARSCYSNVWLDWVPLNNLNSPAFTGVPTAPTAAAGTSTTQLATTAFVAAVQVLLNNSIALRAPLASPALTGTPTAPTAAQTANSTQIATTAFVKAAIAALIDSSPGALDTLKELADALGNDPNFATTVTNLIAEKLGLAGGDVSGQINMALSVTGGYGRNAGSGQAWGSTVWAMGPVYDGSGVGNAYTPAGLYGLAWLRAGHSADTLAGEGVYVYQAGNQYAGMGAKGFWTSGVYAGKGTGLTDIPQAGVGGLVASLAAKAALVSPVFTGVPSAPTPAAADNSTKLATTAFVKGVRATVPANTASLGASGWWKCADTGLITQWVRVTVGDIASDAAGAITWPITFPTAALTAQATLLLEGGVFTGAMDASAALYNLSRTGVSWTAQEWSTEVQNLGIYIEVKGY